MSVKFQGFFFPTEFKNTLSHTCTLHCPQAIHVGLCWFQQLMAKWDLHTQKNWFDLSRFLVNCQSEGFLLCSVLYMVMELALCVLLSYTCSVQ